MIGRVQQTLVRNLPRLTAPQTRCLRYCAASTAPSKLTGPIKAAVLPARAIPSTFTGYPSFRLIGNAGTNTLIGAALLRSVMHRHFSIATKPEENEGTAETTVSTKRPATPAQPRRIHAPNKVIVAQVAWSYTLYKVADQYILSVVCGTIAIYSLEIPLDAQETVQALDGTESLDALAAKIRYAPSYYRERCVYLD